MLLYNYRLLLEVKNHLTLKHRILSHETVELEVETVVETEVELVAEMGEVEMEGVSGVVMEVLRVVEVDEVLFQEKMVEVVVVEMVMEEEVVEVEVGKKVREVSEATAEMEVETVVVVRVGG